MDVDAREPAVSSDERMVGGTGLKMAGSTPVWPQALTPQQSSKWRPEITAPAQA